jgi:hypothetical protein
MKAVIPSARFRMSGMCLVVGVDRPRLFGEDFDCEEPMPAMFFL